MDNYLKDRISTCLNFFKEKINVEQKYELIENKKKIYYFSKFSLNIEEFYLIFQSIKQIKENLFKNILENLKYFSKSKNR
jgi:hypothetical protein